ncbi:hypothetical protein BJX62DRAFT_196980 [Aspergillus germanicus]
MSMTMESLHVLLRYGLVASLATWMWPRFLLSMALKLLAVMIFPSGRYCTLPINAALNKSFSSFSKLPFRQTWTWDWRTSAEIPLS